MIEILIPNFKFEDERGKLIQLVREGYKQVNVIFSKKGVIRGNHYHKINQEMFYIISGKFCLMVELGNRREEYIFQTGDMFKIKPFVKHSFEFLEDTILVSLYDKGVELSEMEKDIYTE